MTISIINSRNLSLKYFEYPSPPNEQEIFHLYPTKESSANFLKDPGSYWILANSRTENPTPIYISIATSPILRHAMTIFLKSSVLQTTIH